MAKSSNLIVSIIAAVTVFAAIFTGIALTSIEKPNEDVQLTETTYKALYDKYATPSDTFTVLDVYMRPDNTFIQGLYFDAKTGMFWEGSGMWGASKVRYLKLDPVTKNLNYDATVPQFVMGGKIFGEGICPLNDNQIVVLTWKNDVVYILNQATLQVEQTLPMFTGAKEGWGVTNFNHPISKNNILYVSDGTD